jgi:DNA polymerase-4
MERKILHLDMDAFFASVEQMDHPEYRGKPVIVGADPRGRGVVSTCSYEARKFGVHSAQPISEAVVVMRIFPGVLWRY